jgi:phosphoribosylformimino-5-aminoimidazole carboxamide ribotide isomerase
LSGAAALAEVVRTAGPWQSALSIDLRGGVPLLAAGASWPGGLRESVRVAGVRTVLYIDLAGVGSHRGVSPSLLGLAEGQHEFDVIVGGGVADRSDLERLRDAGASGVLVATSLHEGRIGRDDLDAVVRGK